MSCASCVAHVEKAARAVAGVGAAQVNLARGRATIQYDPERTSLGKIASAIHDAGYDAVPVDPKALPATGEEQRLVRQQRQATQWKRRAVVGVILWLPMEISHWIMQWTMPAHHPAAQSTLIGWLSLACATIAIVYVGGRFYASALAALKHATSNMDTLISIGATVAYGYSLVYFAGGLLRLWPPPAAHELYFMEASGLLALISLGHWLEARARQSAGSAIRQLLELSPVVALKVDPDHPEAAPTPTPVAQLETGDRVLVRPGDRVPIDGVVVEGAATVDESMLSGEPIPALRQPGDNVIGGTINQDGRLLLRVTKVASQTALAQIVALVEKAQSSKPPVQKLADRISAVFVPTVLAIALTAGIGWTVYGMAHAWTTAHLAAQVARVVCSVLIIACPCALGLAVPAAVMVGTGMGARHGILIRDIDALQQAESVQIIALDKTGTLTQGKPTVAQTWPSEGIAAQEVLRLAASAEQFSAHPLGRAIVAAARDAQLKLDNPESFASEAGAGVVAKFNGRTLLIGSESLLASHGITEQRAIERPASSRVYVGEKTPEGAGRLLGVIDIDDPLKADSARAVAELRQMNLQTVLLSGDNAAAADRVARDVGIGRVHAGVRPAGKAEVIRSLQANGATQRCVAMVGDGINDAPALASADLGIAVGGGSDIAKEAGGIVLVSGSLLGVGAAIRLSRQTMRKIRQNLFLAFIYNIIAIPFAAFGLVNPLVAAAAMALSDVTVIGNALLLRRAWKGIGGARQGVAATRQPAHFPPQSGRATHA